MLEKIGGISSASFNSTYVGKSGTSIRSVQDDNPSTKDTANKKKGDQLKIDEVPAELKVSREEQLKDAIDKINLDERFRRTGCEFTYHEKSNRISITLYDKETKEVVKEIPPEETLKMLDKLYELAGLIIDEKR